MLRDPTRAPGFVPVLSRDRRLGPVERLGGGLDIDPRPGSEIEAQLTATVHRHPPAQLGEKRTELVVRRRVGPESVDQLVAWDGPVAVEREIREGDPPLPSGQLILDSSSLDPGDERAAQLDPGRPQGFVKVSPTLCENNGAMSKLLVHLTHGPEAPTRAALGFLVARTALEEGHQVTLFLAGDSVQLLRDDVLDGLTGVGTGGLREHYDRIVDGGGRFFLSGMSSKARGLSPADVEGKPAELAPPNRLVELTFTHDRVLTY